MVQDLRVGFALAVGLEGGRVCVVGTCFGGGGGVGGGAGLEVGEVALDVAGRAGAARGGEADVVGHWVGVGSRFGWEEGLLFWRLGFKKGFVTVPSGCE